MGKDSFKRTRKSFVNRFIKLHGRNDPFPLSRELKAGNLKMLYENGSIRYMRVAGTEIIRMIYAAVRDDHWLTVQPVIQNEYFSINKNGFNIWFDCRYNYKDIDFRANYHIEATSDNHFVFEMHGMALSSFKKNRIGFCVLHPIVSCAGQECIITHADGSQSKSKFPQVVSPHQPFKNITAMQWKINNSTELILKFYGDVFETEDQRNWTDSSFKTYSTPLEIPYPVEITRDTTVYQKIELDFQGGISQHKKTDKRVIFHLSTDKLSSMPDIGIGVSSRPQSLKPKEAEQLKKISFSHLRAELYLFNESWHKQYMRMVNESRLLALPVELCLFFGNEPDTAIKHFIQKYHRHPVKLKSIALLSENEKTTPFELVEIVKPILRRDLGNVILGAGTNCNFAQLNRSRPNHENIGFISFAIQPQEHASDDKSIFENMAAQMNVVETARLFDGHKPVHVSPVTLQRRFNANISNYEIPVKNKEIPPQIDVRQMSLAGAAWTIGSLKYILESGVKSVSYYETVGERGLMMGDYVSQWPMQFLAKKDMIFPVFHVFRLLPDSQKYKVVDSLSNKSLVVDGFTLLSDNDGLIFLANLTDRPQHLIINGIRKIWTFFKMNTGNYNQIIRRNSVFFKRKLPPTYFEKNTIRMQPYETRILKFLIK